MSLELHNMYELYASFILIQRSIQDFYIVFYNMTIRAI